MAGGATWQGEDLVPTHRPGAANAGSLHRGTNGRKAVAKPTDNAFNGSASGRSPTSARAPKTPTTYYRGGAFASPMARQEEASGKDVALYGWFTAPASSSRSSILSFAANYSPRVTLRFALIQRDLARLTSGVRRRTSASSPSSLAASIWPSSVRYF